MFIANDGEKIWVDGWIPELNTVIEYHGCWWHGCPCLMERVNNNPRMLATRREAQIELQRRRYAKTQARVGKLRDMGLTVLEHWECEDLEEINNDYYAFYKNEMLVNRQSKMSGYELLNLVETGEMFGAVECDMQVGIQSTMSNDQSISFSTYMGMYIIEVYYH
jgi:hypothetical protein